MRSETTTHDRVWRKVPRVPCPPRHPSVRPARSHSLPVERLLPGPLRHPPPPGVSLFRHFRCYLDRPPVSHGLLRYPSPPGVSRFRRIGSHLRRVTQAPRPGAMAAGAQEQAASCDAFVLSRRQPAPGAPPSRTFPAGLVAKPFPEPRPGDLWPGRDCRCEFRQARSRTPPPDSVLAAVGMTDGVWQGGSVMSTLRRGPCRASRRYRGLRNSPCAPPCACCRRRP